MKLALICPKGNFFNNTKLNEFWNEAGMQSRYFMWSGLSPALLLVAALTPKDFEIVIINENSEEIDFNEKYDIVGISFMTQQAIRAYEIADQFRSRGRTVVLGGIHATLMPEEASQHADSVVAGEAEYLWPEFIQDFLNHKIKKIYQTDRIVDLNDSPIPRYDLIKDKGYKTIWMQTTRGCPHDCEFCAASKIYGVKYRTKPMEHIVAEMELIKAVFGNNVNIGFGDDNFLVNKKFSIQLLDEITKMDVSWMGQTDIGIGDHEDILKLLKKSGCLVLYIGLESLSPENLKSIDPWKYKKLKDYAVNIEKIQTHGIAVFGAFIVGLEEDDETVFKRIENFIIDNNIHEAQITILTPLPGTRLRSKLEKENRILPTSWDNYTYFQSNIIHKNLSKEQLENGIAQIYQNINTPERLQKKYEYFKNIFKKLSKDQ